MQSGAYCHKHRKPHLGFTGDDTTACADCIDDEIAALAGRAEDIFDQLSFLLEEPEFAELLEVAELSSLITGQSKAMSVLRFVVARAHRLKKSVDDVVLAMIQDSGSAPPIL